jgi:hypothetical protein
MGLEVVEDHLNLELGGDLTSPCEKGDEVGVGVGIAEVGDHRSGGYESRGAMVHRWTCVATYLDVSGYTSG